MRHRRLRPRALVLLGLWALAPWAPARARGVDDVALEELPRPDLASMEPAVRSQLEDERAAVAALLETPATDPARLGEAFGRLGQLYYGYALRLPAAVCYRNAIALAPDEARWHYYLGVVHQDEGRVEEAIAEFSTANELEAYVPALVRLGDLELGRNRPEDARPFYERALAAHPTSAAAQYGLGRVAAAGGDLAAAVGHYQKALELQPQADRIHYLLGQAYRRMGEMELARVHLEQSGPTRIAFYDPLMVALQRLSVGASAALDRGAEARMQGLYDVALREYRAAVEADPDNPVARRSLGAILAVTGDAAQAIAEFRAALELDPDRPDALFALGRLLAGQGQSEEARPYLARAAELDPQQTRARLALGALLAAAGEWDEAAGRYREVLAVDPGSVEARLELGKVLVQSGRAAEGIVEFDRVIAADIEAESKARAHYYRAIAELRGGDEDGGLARLRQALELDPALAGAAQTLGGLLIRRGRFAEAVAELDRLIEVDPANTQARLQQMSALVLAGDFAGAQRRLEEALTVLPESSEIKFNLTRLLACGPDRAARDGTRAVLLARELTAAAPNLLHVETLAMALAEGGRFDEAAETQQRLVDRARGAGNQPLAARLSANLERYRRGETCDPAALGFGR